MSDLGALLRKAREERGLSLDDIQEVTKIRKRYLEAIESGDYSVLPGTFYVRAFVKNYSEAVGLEPDEVLRHYQHEVPPSPVEQATEAIPVRRPRKMKSQGSERLGKIGFNLVMWSFLILIVVVLWYYAINMKSDSPDKLDNTPITQNTPTPDASGTNSSGGKETPIVSETPIVPTQAPTTVTLNGKSGKADQYDIGPPGGVHTFELKVTGRNWIEVWKGGPTGEKLFYANANDGTTLEYELTEPFYINVGRADLAEIRVDGILVPDGDLSSTKRLLINPLRSDTEEAPQSLTGE